MAEIEVWYLHQTEWRPDTYTALVAHEEQSRAQRFRRSSDAGRFLASRALTRAALARHVNVSPTELIFERQCEHCHRGDHGRPMLRLPRHSAPTVEYSLTRAGPVVAVAIAPRIVGLDAEPPLDLTADALATDVFDTVDQTWIRSAPHGYQSARLVARWVAKEAVGKASGLGIIHARRITVPPLAPGWNAATDALGQRCWLTWLDLPSGVTAALATYDTDHQVVVQDANALLEPDNIDRRRLHEPSEKWATKGPGPAAK